VLLCYCVIVLLSFCVVYFCVLVFCFLFVRFVEFFTY